MTMQHTHDWDVRYRENDTPWEEDSVATCVVDLFREYTQTGARVLDVGCGKGVTSIWLAALGYHVVGCDIAQDAVLKAREHCEVAGVDVRFVVADILAETPQLPVVDVVFTRGVLHTFVAAEGRAALATAVARQLSAKGIWLDVSGSADTPDGPGERERLGLPRLSLGELATAVEPLFEVLSVRRSLYGVTPGRTDFLAWASALRRR